MGLYSYNQMVAIWGKDDKQVQSIKRFIEIIGWCVENTTLRAFRRLED